MTLFAVVPRIGDFITCRDDRKAAVPAAPGGQSFLCHNLGSKLGVVEHGLFSENLLPVFGTMLERPHKEASHEHFR
jgi:hypothetical protein